MARLPELSQVAWPWVQLLLHVEEHAAVGGSPEHDSVPGQVDVDATYGHPFESSMQVTNVVPF